MARGTAGGLRPAAGGSVHQGKRRIPQPLIIAGQAADHLTEAHIGLHNARGALAVHTGEGQEHPREVGLNELLWHLSVLRQCRRPKDDEDRGNPLSAV